MPSLQEHIESRRLNEAQKSPVALHKEVLSRVQSAVKSVEDLEKLMRSLKADMRDFRDVQAVAGTLRMALKEVAAVQDAAERAELLREAKRLLERIQYTGTSAFRKKANALALKIFDRVRDKSPVPQALLDLEREKNLKSGSVLSDDVLDSLWRLAGDGEPAYIERYGKLDWEYLRKQGKRDRSWLQGAFWDVFLREAERKL